MTPDLLLLSVSICAHNPSPINGRVQISTISKTLVHVFFWSLKVGWGRHMGGVLVTTMSDNQFRTLVLLERSLFGLRPQRLLSNNTVFFTNYLIHFGLLWDHKFAKLDVQPFQAWIHHCHYHPLQARIAVAILDL